MRSAWPIAPPRRRCSMPMKVMPFGDSHSNVAAYFDRLKARPSYARSSRRPSRYLAMFPR